MVTINNLHMLYGKTSVLTNINLEAPKQSVTAIIGPSGSGKTTLLRLINLLEHPTSGTISFDGIANMSSLKNPLELRRRMAMVFQKPVLFKGNVYYNVAYGLKVRNTEQSIVASLVQQALEMVGLEGYEKRDPLTLSGGEVQRVALARAIVTKPELLLLDEPTANLDPVSTTMVETIFSRVIGEMGTTVIISTHDMSQGQRMANQVGVLVGGEILHIGNPLEVFNMPKDLQVAQFVGIENMLRGTITANRDGIVNVEVGDWLLEGISNLDVGTNVTACIRPEAITLSTEQTSTSARNSFYGAINAITASGPVTHVNIDCGIPILATVTSKSSDEMNLAEGTLVSAIFKATAVHILPN